MAQDIVRCIGASNHSQTEREITDFYSTDTDCVRDLLVREPFSRRIIEPCCGSGNISKVLEDYGHEVISTDLYDHGYGKSGVDFFTEYKTLDSDVITNPPYGLVTDFLERALDILEPGCKMALFLKLQFLEGQERWEKIFSRGHLRTVYIYSKRVACFKNNEIWQKNDDGSFKLDKNGDKMKVPSAVAYAWYIFDKFYCGDPIIKWIY